MMSPELKGTRLLQFGGYLPAGRQAHRPFKGGIACPFTCLWHGLWRVSSDYFELLSINGESVEYFLV